MCAIRDLGLNFVKGIDVNNKIHSLIIIAILCIVALALIACGRNNGDSSGETDGAADTPAAAVDKPEVPTMPAAQFAQPTTIIKESDEITNTTAAETPEPEGPDVTLGERVYTNKCAECHGAQAEGVADKGEALVEFTMTEDEFTDLLRTGGELGPEHLFGAQAISPDGVAGLYAYVQSLASEYPSI